jgi:hypothetical protein
MQLIPRLVSLIVGVSGEYGADARTSIRVEM